MDSQPRATVRGTLRALHAGERSPSSVVADVLSRLAQRRGDHAWISVEEPAALTARAAELAALPEPGRLPLYGVPFAVKDNIDVAGRITTAGCPGFAYRASSTATAVRRLLDAGAIYVGKTNLDQFATGLTGTRSPYGACSSVVDARMISGGSSSGSAVAVASGVVAFALGTDTAGSGRVPAALNGIVGIKPTRGLVSTAGVVPACRSLDCVSVFAHDVEDASTVLDVLAGSDRMDPWSREAPEPTPGAADRRRSLRVGLPDDSALDFLGDEAMRSAFARAIGLASSLGPAVSAPLEGLLEAGRLLYEGPWVAERLSGLMGFLDAHPEAVLPLTRGILDRGRHVDGVSTFAAIHRLRELKADVDRLFARVDVLLLPTIPTTFTHAQVAAEPLTRNSELGMYTQFANLLDLAVVALPIGETSDGRPASLSIIGPAFSDHLLADVARRLQALSQPGGPPAGTVAGGVSTEGAVPAGRGPEQQAGESPEAPTGAWSPEGARLPNGRSPNGRSPNGRSPHGRSPHGRSPDLLSSGGASSGRSSSGGTESVALAVVGRHLSGESRNHELVDRDGALLETTSTAPVYRLLLIGAGDRAVPGLVRCRPGFGDDDSAGEPGAAIEVEVWSVPQRALGGLLAGVRPPLSLGWVALADGREVLGFLCEAYAGDSAGDLEPPARDITASGGWRAHRSAALRPA